MYITVKGMSRWLIQRIKAMLLCIEYGILFIDTVDMNIKAHNALNAMFVNTVDTGVCENWCENSTLLCIKWPLTPARKEAYLLQHSI